jgi:hypothetical protein
MLAKEPDRVVLVLMESRQPSIVFTMALNGLPQSQRWEKLVQPLSTELVQSGLGGVLNLDTLQREKEEHGRVESEEIAIEFADTGYGRKLLEQIVTAAGFKWAKPATPKRWLDYNCEDYYSSSLAERGSFDEIAENWDIWPTDQVYEDTENQYLAVGGPGCDGIVWGYRRGMSGLWVWHPIDEEFQYLAPTVGELLQAWRSGAIKV